jgi:hypothetical protein
VDALIEELERERENGFRLLFFFYMFREGRERFKLISFALLGVIYNRFNDFASLGVIYNRFND